MNQQQKRRLGRGLAALIGDGQRGDVRPGHPVAAASANRDDCAQPQQSAAELRRRGARRAGAVDPREGSASRWWWPRADGQGHEIVAGERRWRAAQRAGLHELPVLIREVSDAAALEIALVENIQRSDLNALEEAQAFAQLIEQFAYTQQQLADAVGKSRSHIANTLRLLQLPERCGRSSSRGSSPPAMPGRRWRRPMRRRWPTGSSSSACRSARPRRWRGSLGRSARQGGSGEKDPNVQALESALSEALGLAIEVDDRGKAGAGW